ncbi:hypothetical protein B0O80DRAFT_494358 [Mortierella sp. GBAus27b]|nr:hypothetical protein BGX31_009386 [Mortierella sp. GBA43]KAI8360172.1 hypothetical protein B0O80DRAFT_494358 [Mortierella sp. GBAus27b]
MSQVVQQQQRPLTAEIEQLKRSVDSMNSQTGDMLKVLEGMRHLGADHIALPSTEQEKLDREWEYFETVCDQVYFILENTRYKLKRQQDALYQQLNPPAIEEKIPEPETAPVSVILTASSPEPTAITTSAAPVQNDPPPELAIMDTTLQDAQTAAAAAAIAVTAPLTTPQQLASLTDIQPLQSSAFDLEMLSPPTQFDATIGSDPISTAALLSAAVPAIVAPDTSLLDDTFITEDTMLDLGEIGNLGDSLGDMDDMINF